jgi:cytochrome c-type biogenesis protein CcmE
MSASEPVAPKRYLWGIQPRLLFGFIAITLAIVFLVCQKAQKSQAYYVTVTELITKHQGRDMDGLRVTGKVVPGTIDRDELTLHFQMTDGTKAIPVVYKGIVPDTFKEEGEVVVEGCFRSSGTFDANFLMAKCPSKYESSPDQPQQQHPSDIPITSKTS